MTNISSILSIGSCLVLSEATRSHPDIKSVLVSRLNEYYQRLGKSEDSFLTDSCTLFEAQFRVASNALDIVAQVQNVLKQKDDQVNQLIGTSDLTMLRSLLSIAFQWGYKTLISYSISGKSTGLDSSNPLADMAQRLLTMIYISNFEGQLSPTVVSSIIVEKYMSLLLWGTIVLGDSSLSPTYSGVQQTVNFNHITDSLLARLPANESIISLGSILTYKPSLPSLTKQCSSLLSKQLLRPDGIQGLCQAIFDGETPGDEQMVLKLQEISNILLHHPSNMKPEVYFATIIPRMLGLLLRSDNPDHVRAMSFTISRMIARNKTAKRPLLLHLHTPFQLHSPTFPSVTSVQSPVSTLFMLEKLVANADPSPTLISQLIMPILPSLYALQYYLDRKKTSDPALKETLKGIMLTWARVAPKDEVTATLINIVDDEDRIFWDQTEDGNYKRVLQDDREESLSILTPESLKHAEETGEFDVNANIFDLYPDPANFVEFILSINRPEVATALFGMFLEHYQNQKAQSVSTRAILYLQLIMQMQSKISQTSGPSYILSQPEHILTFIVHALEIGLQPRDMKSGREYGAENDTGYDSEGDSDDDIEESDHFDAEEEMVETALHLLLSVLDANKNLSSQSSPVLNQIHSLLDQLCRKSGSQSVRTLASSTQVTLTARLASTSTQPNKEEKDEVQETYQKALKLLEDPLLPVKAHGLMLLRQLVAPKGPPGQTKQLDQSYVPAILTIFLRSVQDEDSYIFLNATQGLAAMVDGYGKEVLRSLVNEYSYDIERFQPRQMDVDVRLRIGEALGIVVRQCGSSLSLYADILVPKLLHVVRCANVPTTLRISSLSILADCVDIYLLALLPYSVDVSEVVLDLLRLERASAVEKKKGETSEVKSTTPAELDATSISSKEAALRRAAVRLFSLLVRSNIKEVHDSSYGTHLISYETIKRAKVILSYVAATDEDSSVRVMANEGCDLLAQMERAIIGL